MSKLDDFLSALSGQESGGNYSAVNRYTGALGRWQVMPGNVSPWAKKYLGIRITAQQFLRTPALQDRLVRAVVSSYVSRYGYRGAASAWYSGNPLLADNYNSQKYGPSIGSYVDSVMKRMGSSGFSGAMTSIADEAIAAMNKAARSVPGVKGTTDPLEYDQHTMSGFEPNPAATDRQEPAATKGLGIDIQDGSGEGQLGMNTSFGVDDTETPTVGREILDTAASRSAGRSDPTDLGAVATGVGLGARSGLFANPVAGFRPSGTWGGRKNIFRSGMHNALDIPTPMGTPVHAWDSGVVESAGPEKGGFGIALRIRNSDGTYTILGHLSRIAGLKPGMRFKPGQVLAFTGNSGDSTGDHLHIEFRRSLYDPSSSFDFTKLFNWG